MKNIFIKQLFLNPIFFLISVSFRNYFFNLLTPCIDLFSLLSSFVGISTLEKTNFPLIPFSFSFSIFRLI